MTGIQPMDGNSPKSDGNEIISKTPMFSPKTTKMEREWKPLKYYRKSGGNKKK